MTHAFHAHAITTLAAAFALGVSATTLVQTNFAPKGTALIGGGYQRAIEERFNTAIPLRRLSAQTFAAINVGLFGQALDGAVIGSSGRLFTREELVPPASEFTFLDELHAAQTQLGAQGITLVPVIVPDKSRIYANDLSHPRMPALEARYGDILNLIADAGLDTIDLQAAFLSTTRTDDLYMQTDTHWSPTGADIAARHIADQIATLELERQEFRTKVGAPEPFTGDLVSFADTGMWRGLVGPVMETLTPIETTAVAPSDDLFGDVDIPLALVGTSFSDRTEFHFEGFLKQHTGLDLINYATSGQGPFAPMRAFLASETLRSNPPKVVIWELPERYITVKE